MGVASVAVYSDADRDSLHARVADEAYHIGPTPAAESYLNAERLIEVAQKSGADAVHPGYGFLAESAAFARAVDGSRTGMDRSPSQSHRGDGKQGGESRRIMAKAGVPMVPGTKDPINSAKEVRLFGEEHGFPVAVKASAGGGGKGFAVARDATEAEGAYSRAGREGEAYFGDGSVYVEKYLPAPRHIEIQVVRDKLGNAVHLGERDCSIQRRHQKLLEECPSPAIDASMREAMGKAALAAAEAVAYDNVGTVEFLVEGERSRVLLPGDEHARPGRAPRDGRGYGKRHREDGIRIAAGERLPFSQEDVSWRGHAIEVRLNAEDAARDFTPSPGAITIYEEPGGPGVRVDSSLRGPGVVSEAYDPLFAKLIVRGVDREEALARLGRALAEFKVEGISTTLPFFRAILADEAFVSGDYTTGFMAERMEGLKIQPYARSRAGPGPAEALS